MFFESINKPTLVLRPEIARKNIAKMAEKARRSGVQFRPHFKTHQSKQIGEWFRAEGVNSITVSSVEMAIYFAENGWTDILIAFTANLRELDSINELAKKVHLGLLCEDMATLTFFQNRLNSPVDFWLEADNGSLRTGLPMSDTLSFLILAKTIHPPFTLKGILTHAGNTYKTHSPEEINLIYDQTLEGLKRLRHYLADAGYIVEISYGDTPALSRLQSFAGWNEVRPGNFIFFDSTQLYLGSCSEDEIAIRVACPVITVYPERNQLALYGGGVHLSKDSFQVNNRPYYGFVSFPTDNGWGPIIPDAYVSALWQEHALVNLEPKWLKTIHSGDLLMVLPSHSCMTVDLYDFYITPDGQSIPIKS